MTEKCNFCDKSRHQVKKLVMGEKAGICDSCINICSEILGKELADTEEVDVTEYEDIDPRELKEFLDAYVTSQDSAKTVLSVAVANHFKRLNSHDKEIDKSNVLLLGPTGSGKTLLAKTISKFLEVPFVIADATQMTEAGYVGEDVESILISLLTAAEGDVATAERGIIFIDEIDKIAKRSTGGQKEVGGEGVQQALLKLVEGTVFSVCTGRHEEPIDIDTSNILFIASGAFVGLDKIKKRKQQPSQIGFAADVNDKYIKDAESDDLIEFGLIPEFVSRFPIIAEVQKLTEADMLTVLTDVENNLVSQYKHLFKYSKVNLTFDKAALRQVVTIAISKKTGARSLRSIMEKALLPHMYNLNKYVQNNINKVRITKSLVNNPEEVKKKNAKS